MYYLASSVVGHACVARSFIAVFKKPSTSSALFSAAPGFRRMKMNTFNNNWRRGGGGGGGGGGCGGGGGVVVVVVHGGKLAFGCFGANTFSTLEQAFGAARVYWACRPMAAWGRHACVGRV